MEAPPTFTIVQLGLYVAVPALLAIALFFAARDQKTNKTKIILFSIAGIALLIGAVLGFSPFSEVQSEAYRTFEGIGDRKVLAYYAPLISNTLLFVLLLVGAFFTLRTPRSKSGKRL